MWVVLDPEDAAYRACISLHRRKHSTEFAEVFKRLKLLCQCLDSGMPLRDALGLKWVHHKYRLGMKSLSGGGRKGQAALRLYIYPNAKHQAIVILGLGDKSTQEKDVEGAEGALAEYLADMIAGEQDGGHDEIQTTRDS